MEYLHKNKGTCSRYTQVELAPDGTILSCHVEGGCSGNIQGMERMVQGQNARDVIARLDGIRCGSKPTSCPDQLAKALQEALARMDTAASV